jgi:hypothetical protein
MKVLKTIYKEIKSMIFWKKANNTKILIMKCDDCGVEGSIVTEVLCPYALETRKKAVFSTLCPWCEGDRARSV